MSADEPERHASTGEESSESNRVLTTAGSGSPHPDVVAIPEVIDAAPDTPDIAETTEKPETTPAPESTDTTGTMGTPVAALDPSALSSSTEDGSSARAPRRLRPRTMVALAAAVAIVALVGGFVATHTSVFAAEAVRVRGIHHLTKAQILRSSGLERGVNVFYLDAGAVEDRIELDPWVGEATVTKDLPSTLILTIVERFAVAVVNDGTVERLVADDGALLDVGAPPGLPRIVAAEDATTADPAAVRDAARALAAMPPEIRRLVGVVTLLPSEELTLELRTGVPVTYGSAGDAASKAQSLAAMIRYAERSGARFLWIDVSVPTAPAGTLVGGEAFA